MLADDAGLDLAADQEHRGGGAVVGPLAAVLLRAAAELGERHHQDRGRRWPRAAMSL